MASGSSDVVFYIDISLEQRNSITRRISYWIMHVIFLKYAHTYMEYMVTIDVLVAAKICSGWRDINQKRVSYYYVTSSYVSTFGII